MMKEDENMVAIPLKWMPWLFLVSGIVGIFEGEGAGFCIPAIAIGAGWLFFKYKMRES